MDIIHDFEFESSELRAFEKKINDRSEQLIEKTIREKSPIQIGDIVIELYGGQKLQVTSIKLYGIDDWGLSFSQMSFSYEGLPLKKDDTPIKNRKPIWFSSFIFNGVEYHMPSYNRKKIVIATIIKERY